MSNPSNFCTIAGNVSQAPKVPEDSKVSVVVFQLAVDRSRRDREKPTKTDFITCEAWGPLGEYVLNNIKIGDAVRVIGEYHVDRAERKDESGNPIVRRYHKISANTVDLIVKKKPLSKEPSLEEQAA